MVTNEAPRSVPELFLRQVERRGERFATVTIATRAATSTVMPARMSRGLSRANDS